MVARYLGVVEAVGSNPATQTKKVVSYWYDFFYPLRSNGISSRNLFACISSKRAIFSLFFAYHHALACIKLRNDEILARKRDILVFGRMISSHFVPDNIHFLRKWLKLQAFFLLAVKQKSFTSFPLPVFHHAVFYFLWTKWGSLQIALLFNFLN